MTTAQPTRTSPPPPPHRLDSQLDYASAAAAAATAFEENAIADEDARKSTIKRNTSLISFKSLDFNLKTIYSSMKGRSHKDGSAAAGVAHQNSSTSSKTPETTTAASSRTSIVRAPYVRVETVDYNETDQLLTFSQSPYHQSAHHRGSFDRTGSQYLAAGSAAVNAASLTADSNRHSSGSSFLSIATPPNVRRSSTSDITDASKPTKGIPASASQQDNRRPSTSDLLRRARERKGGADSTKIGRSVSQGGLPRGGGRAGRRTSMAF